MTTMREQYKFQRAVDAELARAVTKDDILTAFGVVLHDADGEVFWLNHNNRQFADELLRLFEQGAVLMAYMGFTPGRGVYMNVISTQEHCTKLLESFAQEWANCTPSGPPMNSTLRWPMKMPLQ
jgi:hypothetical protein